MEKIVIRGVKLGKRYAIGERERYLALRDLMANALKAPARLFRAAKNSGNHQRDHIWALKDVSFDVHEGEVVGIIGRNGAGKTTLLKILARVTRPTEGYAEVRGSMGSLLEVGTGFHPELTGRENAFLSGAILGMGKSEIERKFDEIVAFAEIERFIDTPLKHYSTGMQMRLAFAVAAHLEPHILLVDEVLAVGDSAFQKKCLGKMGDVARAGRTIIFVSHQMNQIRRLCGRAFWVDGGRLRRMGAIEDVLGAYEASALGQTKVEGVDSLTGGSTRFLSWEVVDPPSEEPHLLASGWERVTLKVVLTVHEPIQRGSTGAYIYDASSHLLAGWAIDGIALPEGINEVCFKFPYLPLRPGAYHLYFKLYDDSELKDYWSAVPELVIGGQPATHFMDEWAGILNIPCELELNRR